MLAESLDIQGRLRAWSYRRQRLGKARLRPSEALRDVIAVYSSHPTTPLSLLARSPSLDAGAFHKMERCREAVRIPGMRG